jgi:WD40 repeat protein
MGLIAQFGKTERFDAPVTAAAGLPGGVALADGAGALHWAPGASVQVHAGAVLCLTAVGETILSGGDDGCVARSGADRVHATAQLGKKWVDCIVATASLVACGTGRDAVILDAQLKELHRFAHPSSLGGLAFDPKGKRLYASHYNGASAWWAANPNSGRDSLEWKGAHGILAVSPDGRFVVTALQDNTLHGWRLPDKAHMRMAGYPAKTKSFAWVQSGPKSKELWLATSGAQPLVCWPFHHKDGPMGKAPRELPPIGPMITAVAAHPKKPFVAAGYADGTVMMFRMEDDADLVVAEPHGSPVSALAYSADGRTLAFGCEDGFAAWLNLPE